MIIPNEVVSIYCLPILNEMRSNVHYFLFKKNRDFIVDILRLCRVVLFTTFDCIFFYFGDDFYNIINPCFFPEIVKITR